MTRTTHPTLLLVEDHEAYAYTVAHFFRQQQCDVVVESDADAAIMRVREDFDVVLVDLNLGGSFSNGLRVVNAWKHAPASEVVVLTGSADHALTVEAMRAGAYDYIVKPVALEELHRRVSEAVAHRDRHTAELSRRAQTQQRQDTLVRELHDGLRRAERVAQLGHWMANPTADGRFEIRASPLVYELLGLPVSDEPQPFEPFLDAVYPPDLEEARKKVRASWSLSKPISFDLRVKSPNEALRWLHVDAEATKEHQLVGIVQDVTAQRRTKDDFDSFFAISHDLFAIASFKGNFERVNPSFSKILGWTAEELMNRPFIEFVHPEDVEATLAEVAKLNTGVMTMQFENRYRARDGSYRVLSWVSVPELASSRMYAVARDVTEEREVRQRLSISERMATVGSLAAGVAHEINNPLAYVLGNIRYALDSLRELSRDGEKGEALAELSSALSEAVDGAERIRVIVRDLKSFARPQDSADGRANVHQVLDGAVSMANNELRHRAKIVRQYGDCPPVSCSDSRLGQVFLNLLINAAQAMPEGNAVGNEIRLRTGTDAEGRVSVEIEDTGCGISADVLPKIFDPFFTTKPVGVGTGLGLYICHNLIRAMDGELSVRSQPGSGTCFTVRLPPAAPSSEDPHAPLPEPKRAARRAKVMFIDDESMLARSAQRLLSKEHDIEVITDARVALERLRGGEAVDVIFCDLMMPNLSGSEFYEQLRRLRPELAPRVVFITGGAFTPSAIEFLSEVPNRRIEKPFGLDELRSATQSLLS